ncbi:sugar transferase [Candidatus Saccharibacteria bacterium]|nr:sugar transferase [Candidatus Saccharibacteria bacterium]
MLYRFIKRLFDIICGLIGLVFLIPITIIVKIAYMCTGDFHRVFFLQERIGKNGKLFKIIKYRTMVVDAEDELVRLMEKNPKIKIEYENNKKITNDPRITKAGRIVRRFSIDEMPQFLNVLIGQMSIVGNRPYLPGEKRDMGKYFDSVVKTKPGITGLWQVSGHNEVPFKSRVELEATYSDIAGFSTDIKIIIRTFKAVFWKQSKRV